MTEEEWRAFPKESGTPVWFPGSNGKPVQGSAVRFISRGATVRVEKKAKDGSVARYETYWPYQWLYPRPDGILSKPTGKHPAAETKVLKVCPVCGKKFFPNPGRKYQKYCSRTCAWTACTREQRRRADEKKRKGGG